MSIGSRIRKIAEATSIAAVIFAPIAVQAGDKITIIQNSELKGGNNLAISGSNPQIGVGSTAYTSPVTALSAPTVAPNFSGAGSLKITSPLSTSSSSINAGSIGSPDISTYGGGASVEGSGNSASSARTGQIGVNLQPYTVIAPTTTSGAGAKSGSGAESGSGANANGSTPHQPSRGGWVSTAPSYNQN